VGLGATYTAHLALIGKLLAEFLLMLIELSLLDVTAEALRVHINWKSAFVKGVDQFRTNFHVEETSPTNHFCTDR